MALKTTLETTKTDLMKAKLKASAEDRGSLDLRLSAVRGALTAVGKAEVAGKAAKVLTDEEIVAVLRKEVKQREDSASVYKEAGEGDRALKETEEAEFLRQFLPAQLDEEATRAVVLTVIGTDGLEGKQAMGRLMGLLKGRSDLDMGLVSKIAREVL